MPSFDIVSEIDEVALRHAVDNANRELSTRFDFRGVEASIEQNGLAVTLKTESDFQVRQLEELFAKACLKQNISAAGADKPEEPEHSGKTFSLTLTFRQGIDQPVAKQIVKQIKESKIKVQASIQGDQVRVNGKKRDDLQAVMALLRESKIETPLQFNNFRD
ncbi:YajQ family cyclic di-GMP-binding protein [Alcanivorax sp. HI0083]|uniref:YajQ family cyclic di-GMP-binding protein n=1 Tax=unclassified Alcanivorax TaxID=2638842 RepID=UPI0007B7DE2C|nr:MULTISPECIES: YajQ family cyclic di-GMP-binding protein [unclassified Alcanivorax]KZY31339.1 YajQ family cyclic di-GMP-binding protein [Alcanivorax sp. HI0044]KZY38887.1 YajQ family cyclic di-GMP-binding protein [Alcanivorax sp. HI0044]KZZ26313.1 YajQ family cyclic di-GMP-binding protein [Alcanivorax sp. HI0083]PHR63408.1 MAG: YajQ family cyclic di-GMP-binding protein [Alcanivorax sp.]